jgi:anaerobic magnesium-protoporphyrin IX monomethyl ester cyclase
MKISLINIRPRHSAYGLFSIAPLGVITLATILKQKGHEVVVYDEARTHVFNDNRGRVEDELLKSDVIGLSVISPAAARALQMLKVIREERPDVRILVGGPHVLGQQQAETFAEFADVVVQGEAEELLEDLIEGNRRGIVRGKHLENLDVLPVPDLTLMKCTKAKYLDFFKLTPVSTARGCPRNCEFCTVSQIHGHKVRWRAPELVMQELRKRRNEGYKRIFFVDDNFSVHPSKRKPLLEAMAAEREKGNWFQSMIVQDEVPGILRGGEEYIRLMHRAGIKTVMLGVESFDDDKLRALHKTHSRTDSEKALRLLRKQHMIIYAFGMARPETDDKESIRRQFRKLREEGVTYADMTIETPFPGTPYWEKYKDQLIAQVNGEPDWDKWTLLSPVIPTRHMKPGEFQKTVKRSMQHFYSPWRALKKVLQGNIRSGLTILYVWLTAGRLYS